MVKPAFFRQRPLVGAALALLAGVILGIRLPWVPGLLLAGLLGGVALTAVLILQEKPLLAGICALLLFAGALYSGFLSHPSPPEAVGRGWVTAVVEEPLSPRNAGGWRAWLRDAVFEPDEGGRVSLGTLYWTGDEEEEDTQEQAFLASLAPGDRIRFRGKVYEPSGAENPHGFDFRLYLLQNGARAGVSGCAEGETLERGLKSLSARMEGIRQALGRRMDRIFSEASAYPRALILGERNEIDEGTRADFQRLGVAHILAVSGLHVALLAGLAMAVMRLLGLGPRVRTACVGVLLLGYGALLGFPVSAVRAGILFFLNQVRLLYRRSWDPLTGLAAALMVVLVLFPLSVLSVGTAMTFGAVLGIHLMRNRFQTVLRRAKPRALWEALTVTAGATWGMAVPAAAAYHSFSFAGLLLSPVACVLLGVLLPAYLAVFALGCVYLPLGQALAGILRAVLGWIPELLRGFPSLSITVPSPSGWFLTAFIAVTFLLSRYCILDSKRKAAWAAAIVVLCTAGSLATAPRGVRYIQFSVGQADAAVVEDGKSTLILDTGRNGTDLAAYLLAEGRRPDTVLLTHLHGDHCGGIVQLLENGLIPGEVLLPWGADTLRIDDTGRDVMRLLEERSVPVRYLSRGDCLSTERVRITILWPEEGKVRPEQDPNAYPMAGILETQGIRLLFTGDLEGAYEEFSAVEADILKVAHHGSQTSTSQAFLDSVAPSAVLVSCSRGRALPHQETMDRLAASGAAVYRTDECGALTVTFSSQGYSVTPWLKSP